MTDVHVETAGRPRARRFTALALLAAGGLVTMLGVLLVIAAWSDDNAIASHRGDAIAEVLQVSFQRTLVSYQTPDGAEHIPSGGVLYPESLKTGDFVRVEYDQRNPDLVRVAGRTAWLTLQPVGLTVLGVWVVVAPTLWWLRRKGPLFRV